MVTKYRLGLDVGTASIGAAAVELNDSGEPLSLIWHQVRIFSEPLEQASNGKLASKKAARRKARMQRRQIDRRASRLRHIAHLAFLLGLSRKDITPDDGNRLPQLRAKAAIQRVELDDLMRILLRLSKRRGYRGEFKNDRKGEIAEGSSELDQAMKQLAQHRGVTDITLGQFLYHRLESGLPTKLKVKEPNPDSKSKKEQQDNIAKDIKNLYALRSMVEKEFDTIWETQSLFHEVLKGSYDGKLIRDHFHEVLFFQRPLKSAADLVGQCSLEPTLSRAPRAQMAFQRFRIEKTLADLRWGIGRRAKPLEPSQKSVLRELLDQHDKVKFLEIYEALEQAGCPRPTGKALNLDRISREELLGNSTLAALRKLDKYSQKHHPGHASNLEQTFRSLDEKTQVAVINFLADIGSPEQIDDPYWHTSNVKHDGTPRNFKPVLIEFINNIKVHDHFDRLNKMGFEGGRASYSVKALKKLATWLAEPDWTGDWQGDFRIDEESAIRQCYPKTVETSVRHFDKLPAPESTGNAVVDGALRQIRWTVNRMIADLGTPPTDIVVELAREMSLGISRRNERESDNNKQRKARRNAEKEIREHGQTPTPSKIRRYLLWTEQDKSFCPYCNQVIGIADALSGAATEYEHILPRSLTQIGMKRSEIVLAHHICNQEKGDYTPWERWGETPRWQSVEAAAARFEKNKHFRKAKLLRLKDFEREVLADESINEFADRQFHQTSWIAKEAALWLQCICPHHVSVSRGAMTALLRRKWGLDTVIPQARIESHLPLLDEEGKTISPEDFDKLRAVLEGHPVSTIDRDTNPGFDFSRRPNKRLDHRHHLIDAITLALTSVKIFQEMARRYKTAAEKLQARDGEIPEMREKRLRHETLARLEVREPPLRNVRVQAMQAVKDWRISIKPDRFPDGALFKDTAYGMAQREGEDKIRLTLRHAIADLGKVKNKTSEESARKAIGNIVNESTRLIISEEFERRLSNGYNPIDALSEPIIHPLYGTAIRKVHCFEGYAEDAVPIIHTSRKCEHRKYLINSGYAYLELPTDEKGKPQLVTIREAMHNKNKSVKENTIRLFKGDVVKNKENNQRYRICLFRAAGTIGYLPIWEPRSFKEANEKAEIGIKVGGSISFKTAAKKWIRIIEL